MTTTEHSDKPVYLTQATIRKLLLRFLHRLEERQKRLTENPALEVHRIMESIKPVRFPELFDPQHASEDEVLWADLLQLEKDAIVTIEKTKGKIPYNTPPWQDRRIVFDPASEARIREWLNKPLIDSYQLSWDDAVEQNRIRFKNPQLLQQALFRYLNKPALDIVERLARIPDLLSQSPLTAYQLSAQLMWGNSKVLRDKERWLADLLNLPARSLLPRPIILEIAFPSVVPTGILLIENLDSYIAAVEGLWPDCDEYIFVYTQGFKGAASRIRQRQVLHMHIHNKHQPTDNMIHAMQQTWFSDDVPKLPMQMITDLDWSGMGIFRAVKDIFPQLQAWQTGYKQMLTAQQAGLCHPADDSGKALQNTVSDSGSAWLNEHVLPKLVSQCYVDQEVICSSIIR